MRRVYSRALPVLTVRTGQNEKARSESLCRG